MTPNEIIQAALDAGMKAYEGEVDQLEPVNRPAVEVAIREALHTYVDLVLKEAGKR